jgi:quercetin dioxygenase-like cupin family protein
MQKNILQAKIMILFLIVPLIWKVVYAQNDFIIQLAPSDLKWQENSKLHGLQTITLVGNPDVAEPYAERVKIPAHSKLLPHSHPNPARMITVLAGTLYFAFGDKFDETQLKAFPAGSFFTEPVNLRHYAMTKEEEVILQLNAIGPASTDYVKESTH